MKYVWLGKNEKVDTSQNVDINRRINVNTPIDNMSIGGFFKFLFGVKITYDIDLIF